MVLVVGDNLYILFESESLRATALMCSSNQSKIWRMEETKETRHGTQTRARHALCLHNRSSLQLRPARVVEKTQRWHFVIRDHWNWKVGGD